MDTTGWTAINWIEAGIGLCVAVDLVVMPMEFVVRFIRKVVFRLVD